MIVYTAFFSTARKQEGPRPTERDEDSHTFLPAEAMVAEPAKHAREQRRACVQTNVYENEIQV